MRASAVAALAAGGVAVGVVTATVMSAGSTPDRDPLTPIVVETPGAREATGSSSADDSATPVPPADPLPAPPPALRPDERAGFTISEPRPDQTGGWQGEWADDAADDTWDDTWDEGDWDEGDWDDD